MVPGGGAPTGAMSLPEFGRWDVVYKAGVGLE